MNKTFAIILAMSVMIFGSTAYAGAYITGQASNTNFDFGDGGDIDSTFGGGVGVGFDLSSWLAIEATADHLGSDIESGTKYQTRAATVWFVVDPTIAKIGSMPLKVTARAGYARTEFKFSGGEITDSDPAYGAGVALGVSNNTEVFLDYRQRSIESGGETLDFQTTNLGLKYTF